MPPRGCGARLSPLLVNTLRGPFLISPTLTANSDLSKDTQPRKGHTRHGKFVLAEFFSLAVRSARCRSRYSAVQSCLGGVVLVSYKDMGKYNQAVIWLSRSNDVFHKRVQLLTRKPSTTTSKAYTWSVRHIIESQT